MGTLLIDLSNGVDLERAVKSYENIMAPSNYKRPTALITKKQIEAAQKKVEELGLTDALPRRHARVEDIKVCPKMKSDNDLQNSDNCVVLKTVSPQILDKLRESGLTVCTCCEFPGTAWLVFRPNMPTSDIHGEGYDFEEIGLFGTEAVLKYFEANTPNYVDCGTDVDKFINICLQFK